MVDYALILCLPLLASEPLENVPGVASVKVAVGAEKPATRIIHVLDWHHVKREAFAADYRDAHPDATDKQITKEYAKHLDRVEAVQKAHRAILTALVEKHDLRAVYIEGLTRGDVEVYRLLVGVYRRRGGRELGLRIGAAGQLAAEKKIKRVLPAEDAKALQAANPVGEDGKVKIDQKKQEAREDAIVRRLLKAGPLAVVVLGSGHDLSDNVRRLGEGKVAYVRVMPEGHPDAGRQRKP